MKRTRGSCGQPATTVTQGDVRPKDGDVVIWEDTQAAAGCTIGTFPTQVQLQYTSYIQALEVARRFARQRQVDCWLTREGSTFMQLGRYRRVA